VVDRDLRLWRAEGSLRQSGETLPDSGKLASGDSGLVSGVDISRSGGGPQSLSEGLARTCFFFRSSRA
jgi:hypothetical protein